MGLNPGRIGSFSWLYSSLVRPDSLRQNPHRYVLAVVVYLVCVPGVLALCLTLFHFVFLGTNLLKLPILVYFLPIGVMVFSLVRLSAKVALSAIPGFERLSALILALFIGFLLLFTLSRTRIWLIFGGSFLQFLIIGLVLFAGLNWAINRLFGPKPTR